MGCEPNSQDTTSCGIHKKELSFFCYECKKIICGLSFFEDHRSHLTSVKPLKEVREEKIEHIWSLLSRMANKYQSYDENEIQIVKYYAEVLEHLRIREYATRKSIVYQKELLEENIKIGLAELNILCKYVVPTQVNNNNNKDNNKDNNNNNNEDDSNNSDDDNNNNDEYHDFRSENSIENNTDVDILQKTKSISKYTTYNDFISSNKLDPSILYNNIEDENILGGKGHKYNTGKDFHMSPIQDSKELNCKLINFFETVEGLYETTNQIELDHIYSNTLAEENEVPQEDMEKLFKNSNTSFSPLSTSTDSTPPSASSTYSTPPPFDIKTPIIVANKDFDFKSLADEYLKSLINDSMKFLKHETKIYRFHPQSLSFELHRGIVGLQRRRISNSPEIVPTFKIGNIAYLFILHGDKQYMVYSPAEEKIIYSGSEENLCKETPSICYDGTRYIYLMGGLTSKKSSTDPTPLNADTDDADKNNDNNNNNNNNNTDNNNNISTISIGHKTIVRYDTISNTFEKIQKKLPQKSYGGESYYFNNRIYTVGGYIDQYRRYKFYPGGTVVREGFSGIRTFKLETQSFYDPLLLTKYMKNIYASCLAPIQGYIYILGSNGYNNIKFIEIDLLRIKTSSYYLRILNTPQYQGNLENVSLIHYEQPYNSFIVLATNHGETSNLFTYNVKANQWTTIKKCNK